jgi:hypothetical protein
MMAYVYALLILVAEFLLVLGLLGKKKKPPQVIEHHPTLQPRLNRDPSLSLGRRKEDEAGGES